MAPTTVRAATPNHNIDTITENTVPSTSRNGEPSSRPSWQVLVANTPSGNVNPHQPILKGNVRVCTIEPSARNSHSSPNPHSTSALMKPSAQSTSPVIAGREFDDEVPVVWAKSD